MITNINCPYGKVICDGCEFFGTADCMRINTPNVYTITAEQSKQVYERQYNELMRLSKETLVEMIIGKRM